MTPWRPFKLMSHVLLIDVHFRSFYFPVVSWCTLQCTSRSQMHFVFWAFRAEEYSIKGWQLGALPGWHRSCPRLAHCLATPMNIYCTSCYLCSTFHMHFSSCLQIPVMELLYVKSCNSEGQTQAPILSLQAEEADDFTCCNIPVSFPCLLLWKVAVPD